MVELDLNLYTAPWNIATIYNLRFVTEAQVLFTILSKLRDQGEQSSVMNKGLAQCNYRLVKAGRVLKCAAGFLIPESFEFRYESHKNSLDWGDFIAEYRVSRNYFDLITSLQILHDHQENWVNGNLLISYSKAEKIKNELITDEGKRVLQYFIDRNP